jgi:hypothetical protein
LRSKDHAAQFDIPEPVPAKQAFNQGSIVHDALTPAIKESNEDFSTSVDEDDSAMLGRQGTKQIVIPPFATLQAGFAAAQSL